MSPSTARGRRLVGVVGAFRAYLGMKHSPPFIAETIGRMREDGIERAIGIVMAPHWSGMSVESYVDRVREGVGEGPPAFDFVRSYHDDPRFVSFLAARVANNILGVFGIGGRIGDQVREKAGMAGWAQVNGLRGDTSIEERTKYDLWYIENWSIWLDVKIILKTVWRTVLREDENAY